MSNAIPIKHLPVIGYDPDVSIYDRTFPIPLFDNLKPWEHKTGWRDEQMAGKVAVALNATLNPTTTFKVSGPDALRFLKDTCVNSFENFPIGGGKHAILCNDEGLVMVDGVLLRLAEDEFITYWLDPYIGYALQKGDYDAVGEDLTGQVFLFQITGPNSLATAEKATGEDLSDIRFMRHRETTIAGHPVRIVRMGMSGTLAYEVHGAAEDGPDVYAAIEAAGADFGLRKLGVHSYMMNHTEAGFPQAYYHFPYPWFEDEGFAGYLAQGGGGLSQAFVGSMGPDRALRFRTPFELGWGKMVKFDHDFVGREALEREAANPRRTMVTLLWNVDDILDVHRSQFEEGEHYAPIDTPIHYQWTAPYGTNTFWADQVLKDDEVVGISSGRAYSYYSRDMISLCSIDIAQSELGTEVEVLWGEPGTRQKKIRATVVSFPYLADNRNQSVDAASVARAALV
jgi:glycine cleavage system aminomethyltransferase T